MDKNPELQKQAKTGEIAIKGTNTPDITTEPVAPVRVLEDAPPPTRADLDKVQREAADE